jgi:3'(2'), 5'-bisphosphate nucleotidase
MTHNETDARLAAQIAHEAGALLLDLQRCGDVQGKELGVLGDSRANAYLMNALRAARPHDAILSEEESDTAARLDHDRVWIIDPLDGTREYSEGRSDWAVHVALSIGGMAAHGAVALPGLGITLASDTPASPAPVRTPYRIVVSRTRPAIEAVAVAKMLGAQLIPMGSAGAKAMAVVRGEADIYVHSGGQYEWDNCAPVAVALAAGYHCSRIDGSPLKYNNKDTYLPDLLICHKKILEEVMTALASI